MTIDSAIDGYSRLAYSDVLDNEQSLTSAEFFRRAQAFSSDHGITIERVLSDNGACYRSRAFGDALGEIAHSFTRPYRPQTNGKACSIEHL